MSPARCSTSRPPSAISHRALELAPADYGILVNRGAMRARRRQFALATKDLQRAIEIEPEQYEAYSNLSRIYSAQEKWREAIEQIDRGDPLRSPARASFIEIGPESTTESGNADEAARSYAKAIELEPAESPFVNLWRAEDHLAKGRYKEAIAAFDLYEKRAVPDAQFYQGRGLAKALIRDYPGAVDDYSRSLELEPNSNVRARRGWAIALHGDDTGPPRLQSKR